MAQRALRDGPAGIQPLQAARDAFERRYLVSVMRVANGNVATAARLAGRNRTEFYKLLASHGIDVASFKDRQVATDLETRHSTAPRGRAARRSTDD